MRSPLRPRSLRTVAAIAFATYGALACAVLLPCLTYVSQRLATAAASEKALAVAGTAALSVDVAAHLEAQNTDDRRALERVSDRQREIWGSAPRVAALYTLMPLHTGWHYAAVSDYSGHPEAKPGDGVWGEHRPALSRALERPIADTRPYTRGGRTLAAAYAPVRGPDGRPVAVLVAEVPVAATALPAPMAWVVLGAALAVIFLGMAFGSWRGRSVVRGLRALAAANDRLARGHVIEPLPVSGANEIARLTEAFNRMLGAMADRAHDANTDGLTGLYNHRYFQERLAQEVVRASRYDHRVALLMIDIDHFKHFNDRYGHPAGDDVLQQVTATIRGAIRDIDVAARYGGEEFVVIMPEADSFAGVQQAELVRLAVKRHRFEIKTDESLNHHSATEEPEVTISIGVAECPANASDPESLVMAADMALLRAKQMGRDRVCAYRALDVIEGDRDCRELHRLIHQERTGQPASSAGGDDFTCAHCRSVTRYAMTLAHALDLGQQQAEEVRRAALWVDVSRSKHHHQQDSSMEAIAADLEGSRAATADDLMNRTFRAKSVSGHVVHRHEWYNGRGYPDGLAGDQIPLAARILAVADSYERLLAGNGNGGPMSPAQALRALEGRAGTQLDPHLVATFRAAIEAETEGTREIACATRSRGGGETDEQGERDGQAQSPQELTGSAKVFAD